MGRRSGKLIRKQGLDARLEVARENKEAREKRSPEAQLKVLDKRLGKNQGAAKERARLLKQIEEAKTKTEVTVKDDKNEKAKDEKPKGKTKAKDRRKQSKKSATKEAN